jgi:probable F420-dependent oxidoreductase
MNDHSYREWVIVLEIGMSTTGVDRIAERAKRLEYLGYDYVGVGEHISFHLPTSSPLIALAAAASVTSRIKLLSSIVTAPIYPGALLAKMGATLDQVSGGRFTLGVGIAGENSAELEACGVPASERGKRADEVLTIVRKLWTEDHVDHDGRWATLRDISVRPRPVQVPHPPIWVSGRQDPAIRRAARLGDGWMPYLFTPEKFAGSLTKLTDYCEEAERDRSQIKSIAFVFTSCHEDTATAKRLAVERLSRQYNQDFTDLVDRFVVHGTPAQCESRLREYVDAGADALMLASACSDNTMEDNEALLAREVVPKLR